MSEQGEDGGQGKALPESAAAAPTAVRDSDRNIVHVTYLLFALSLVSGLTAIAGVIVAHLKLGDVRGTILESHYQWLIRTFWIALAAGFVSALLSFIGIGLLLIVAVLVWYIYRLVKGWLRLNDGKAIDDPTAWI